MATERDGVRFVFILGTGRCGSSLVHEVLAKHPGVGFLSNVDDRIVAPAIVGRWNGRLYRRLPPSLSVKGRIRFAPSEGYRILGKRVSPAICAPSRDLTADDATPWLARRFRRFFEERAHAQRAPVFLHKFTGWPRARFIDAALDDVRFVHVMRDGRAVANSLVQMHWWRGYGGPETWGWGRLPEVLEKEWEATGRSFPVLAALEWKILMDAFEEAAATIPPERWLDVRYEDVVREPRESTARILRWLDLEWDPEFERSFARYRFDASKASAYARNLRHEDVRAIDAAIGPDLQRFGYAPVPDDRPDGSGLGGGHPADARSDERPTAMG
jgi:hypothetical protein